MNSSAATGVSLDEQNSSNREAITYFGDAELVLLAILFPPLLVPIL
jgi:hypothetical protein